MSRITYADIQKLASSFEGVTEEPHFEKTSFRIKKKIFLTFDPAKNQAVVKLTMEDQSLFCSHNKAIIYPVPGAWGKKGYTMIEVKPISKILFSEIVKTSYHTVKG